MPRTSFMFYFVVSRQRHSMGSATSTTKGIYPGYFLFVIDRCLHSTRLLRWPAPLFHHRTGQPSMWYDPRQRRSTFSPTPSFLRRQMFFNAISTKTQRNSTKRRKSSWSFSRTWGPRKTGQDNVYLPLSRCCRGRDLWCHLESLPSTRPERESHLRRGGSQRV